jgi:hypothetical protein
MQQEQYQDDGGMEGSPDDDRDMDQMEGMEGMDGMDGMGDEGMGGMEGMEGMDEFADDGGVPSPDRMEDEEPAEN